MLSERDLATAFFLIKLLNVSNLCKFQVIERCWVTDNKKESEVESLDEMLYIM